MSSLFFFFFFPIDGLIKSKIPFPRGLKFNFFLLSKNQNLNFLLHFSFLSQYRIRKRQQFRPFSLTYNSLLTPALAECMLTGEGIIIKEPSLSLSLWNTFFFFIGSRLAAKPLVHAITLLHNTHFSCILSARSFTIKSALLHLQFTDTQVVHHSQYF